MTFHLPRERSHVVWDRELPPALTVAPGDDVRLDLSDASGGQLGPDDGPEALARLDFGSINPCTGPVLVDGAQPGDILVVTILGIETAGWAWTANIPGFGLLAADFPQARLWCSTVREGSVRTPVGVDVPARPMIGTIGVATADHGRFPLLVPTEASGGNMDTAQMGEGTRLHLPVRVPGALFSAGDTHAVQGDGEVCGTGAETPATLHVRFDLEPQGATGTGSPWYEHSVPTSGSSWFATTGIGPDLFQAARDATRRAVDLLSTRTGLAPVDAYLLASLVGELRISEIVDAPHWVVSMHLPATVGH